MDINLLNAVYHELNFWKDFVKTSRFQDWLADKPTPELWDVAREKIKLINPETILDVGSGPVSILTGLTDAKITTVDPLGDLYRIIFDFEKHEVDAPLPYPAEELFVDKQFDLVHISNALDHCKHPPLALNRLWQAVKNGGWLIVQGFFNEGEHEGYAGFYAWNLGITDDNKISCNGAIISEPGEAKIAERASGRLWFMWCKKKD